MRLSRGRSTPTRRAMWWLILSEGTAVPSVHGGVWSCRAPAAVGQADQRGPGLRSGGDLARSCRTRSDHVVVFSCGRAVALVEPVGTGSALALLVTRVLADHHDAAVATDHLALVTDSLDA